MIRQCYFSSIKKKKRIHSIVIANGDMWYVYASRIRYSPYRRFIFARLRKRCRFKTVECLLSFNNWFNCMRKVGIANRRIDFVEVHKMAARRVPFVSRCPLWSYDMRIHMLRVSLSMVLQMFDPTRIECSFQVQIIVRRITKWRGSRSVAKVLQYSTEPVFLWRNCFPSKTFAESRRWLQHDVFKFTSLVFTRNLLRHQFNCA